MITVVFDTETTNLAMVEAANIEQQPRIIEFAAIKLDANGDELERLDLLVDPGMPIPEEAQRITGITDEMVKGQPRMPAIWPRIANFMVGANVLVAHNLPFDLSVMRYEAERLGKLTAFPWPPRQICTVERSLQLKGYKLNLGDLYELAFGERFSGAHRAMVDVEALVKCYLWLKSQGHI